jgi:hypothetical protein
MKKPNHEQLGAVIDSLTKALEVNDAGALGDEVEDAITTLNEIFESEPAKVIDPVDFFEVEFTLPVPTRSNQTIQTLDPSGDPHGYRVLMTREEAFKVVLGMKLGQVPRHRIVQWTFGTKRILSPVDFYVDNKAEQRKRLP